MILLHRLLLLGTVASNACAQAPAVPAPNAQEAPAPAVIIPKNESVTEEDTPAKNKPLDPEELKKSIKKISDHEYQLGEMKLDTKTKSLRFPAMVKIVKGPLEYLIVHETGSAHEALFTTKVTPFEINVALLLLGYKPCEAFFFKKDPEAFPQAAVNPEIGPDATFDVLVEWKDEQGKLTTNHAEDWIFNLATEKTVAAGAWVYNASFLTPEKQLAAQLSGNVISLYLDPVALANNPRKGNENDDIWDSRPALKTTETPVTLIFQKSAVPSQEPVKSIKPSSKK
jgi:hypothetical protein